jgi:hypothetical protein
VSRGHNGAMSEEEHLDVDELEEAEGVALPDREAMSIGGFGDEIVDFNYDHPYLPPELDGYEPPEESGSEQPLGL